MEQDITKQLWQEERFAFLSQTVENLGDTLMHLSMTQSTFEAWLANGLFIVNKCGKIIYAIPKKSPGVKFHRCLLNASRC
jgi:hypothetical protein